jgi:3-hydroxyisobutyrate dehydrogenase-like beta-hydroxyacid dehydrogenase
MPQHDTKAAVAVIGLGNLGLAIATNLASRGWQVAGFDTSAARVDLLETVGGTAATPASLHEASLLCFVVPDDEAIREVLTGANGLLPRLGRKHTVLVHSTVLPSRVRELASIVQQAGAAFVDAPVSGGAERARHGDLAVFAGGGEQDLARARPLLQAIGSRVVHLGPAGAGAAAKLANQLVMFAALSGLYEALDLTAAYGVAENDVLVALSTGTADTWVGRNWGFFDQTAADYDQSGVPQQARPWRKDLAEIGDAARDRGLRLPLAELIAGTVADQIERRAVARAGSAS